VHRERQRYDETVAACRRHQPTEEAKARTDCRDTGWRGRRGQWQWEQGARVAYVPDEGGNQRR
jgi:hypothetical protein